MELTPRIGHRGDVEPGAQSDCPATVRRLALVHCFELPEFIFG
jgi:hypothetical protein